MAARAFVPCSDIVSTGARWPARPRRMAMVALQHHLLCYIKRRSISAAAEDAARRPAYTGRRAGVAAYRFLALVSCFLLFSKRWWL